ncbi:DUF1702 family protein [Aquimarina sp. D1M17]|uniref:DUF1702 family protein n=1 Tax=Aquimarina acroporae TaxID=2937283 RepID=UPI0020BFB4E9|nr:DUF1702 family protein [Aquimarina acroporae]MCK8522371.1 DUF1702 family protein [Aquimarina acroporae]
MIYNFKTLRKQILGLSLSEGNFSKRGFEEGSKAQKRLEDVGKTVMMGYNVAVENGRGDDMQSIISAIKSEKIGFFHEGIAMGLYTLDLFSITRKNHFWNFVKEEGNHHEYMAYIGAGLAIGVFNKGFEKFIAKACPMCGCLVLDGIGFYHAFFKPKRTLKQYKIPKSIEKNRFYLERFDNGVGRAIWFYDSGNPEAIAKTIHSFPADRRGDIWSGVGLAAAYAGGVPEEDIFKLKKLSGNYSVMLGQGAFLAAHTRHKAGNPTNDESTVEILVGESAKSCDELANQVIEQLDKRNRYVDNKPSFQVFLEYVQDWVSANISYQESKVLSLS